MSSSQHALRDLAHARFRIALGEPHKVEGGGADWSLPPANHNGEIRTAYVHVILTGFEGPLGVWVFDPYDHTNSVIYELLTDEAQIDCLLACIELRVRLPSSSESPLRPPPPASPPTPQ